MVVYSLTKSSSFNPKIGACQPGIKRHLKLYGIVNYMSTPDKAFFRKRLGDTRKLRDLNQEGLAKKAALPSTAISHFESGTRKPSFDNLRKLADALDVSIDYLMGRTDEMSGNLVKDAEIFRDYENMTEGDRELARDFMSRLAERNTGK